MALANKDRMPPNNITANSQVADFSSQVEKNGDQIIKSLTGCTQSSPSAYPNTFVFRDTNNNYQVAHEVSHSVISFKNGMFDNNESFVSFEQSKSSCVNYAQNMCINKYSDWEADDDHDHLINYGNNHIQCWNDLISDRCRTDPRLIEDVNRFQTSSNYCSMTTTPAKEKQINGDDIIHGSTSSCWLYTEATDDITDSLPESETHEAADTNKRPNLGENIQALKKQCTSTSTNATKKHKPKSNPAKDPQSIPAKNRRERISERLKILQELVPNGSKVDLVTMLEKAISYVNFLQLQVKVLATDEFWPVQGGKAPDISQVREAIDAILSSQRDRTSSSSNSGK